MFKFKFGVSRPALAKVQGLGIIIWEFRVVRPAHMGADIN